MADYRGYVGFQGSYDLWQYSSTGRVNGIGGNVDLDYSYKNFLPLLIETGKNGYGKGPNLVPVAGKELCGKKRAGFVLLLTGSERSGGLPAAGGLPGTAMSDGEYLGYTWVTFTYGDSEFWATLRPGCDRAAGCAEAGGLRRGPPGTGGGPGKDLHGAPGAGMGIGGTGSRPGRLNIVHVHKNVTSHEALRQDTILIESRRFSAAQKCKDGGGSPNG